MGSIPIRHPIEKSSNGRTPPFEGVYLGSSPSFSASRIGVTVARWSPKPLVGVQISHPSPTLLAQWIRALDYGSRGRRFKSYRECLVSDVTKMIPYIR
jgi:hypothetical protein